MHMPDQGIQATSPSGVPKQPTILVKRADGTMVRMTLDEVKAFRQKEKKYGLVEPVSVSKGMPSASFGAQQKRVEPMKPKIELKLDPEKKAVLEKTMEMRAPTQTRIEPKIELKTGPITSQIRPVPKKGVADTDSESRVLQARIQAEARKIPTLPEKKWDDVPLTIMNGLPSRATEAEVREEWGKDDYQSLLDPSLHEDLPMVVDAHDRALSTTTPVTQYFVDKAAAEVEQGTMSKEQGASGSRLPGVNQMMRPSSPQRVPVKPSMGKPVMHDVVPPKPRAPQSVATPRPVQMPPISTREMPRSNVSIPPQTALPSTKFSVGPVEELGGLTLVDFRRLGSTPKAAANKVLEKFMVLKDESYLLYLNAVEEWYRSPIIQLYLGALKQAVQKRIPLSGAVASSSPGTEFTFVDLEAIVEINRALG